MSMYNLLFGTNAFADFFLAMLGTERDRVPRFRDCYLSDEGDKIVIHTRTGGGNRPWYDSPEMHAQECNGKECDMHEGPFNSDLRKLWGFIEDHDQSFDSTYADFSYRIRPEFAAACAYLREQGGSQDPEKRWKQVLKELEEGKNTPATARAKEVGKVILEKVQAVMKKGI